MKHRKRFPYSLFTGLFMLTSFFAQGQAKTEQHKTANLNKQLALRFFEEVLNRQSLAAIDELYAPDVVDHTAFPDQAPGVEGIKGAIGYFLNHFDRLQIKVEEAIAEGDKVVTRETWSAIHKPTGKPVKGSVIHIFRIRDGRITDEWSKGWEWLDEI